MRRRTVLLLAVFPLVSPCAAQQEKHDLPPMTVEGGQSPDNCVDVQIGDTKTYDCLNGKLKSKSDSVVPLPNIPPISTGSSDIKKGIVNVPAVRQQYGPNFGKSAVPYRPPAGTYGGIRPPKP